MSDKYLTIIEGGRCELDIEEHSSLLKAKNYIDSHKKECKYYSKTALTLSVKSLSQAPSD